MTAVGWIDWERMAVLTDSGTVLIGLTLKQIELDLSNYLWHLRTGMEIQMINDWAMFFKTVSDLAAKNKTENPVMTNGDIDPKKAVQVLEKDLLSWIKVRDAAELAKKKFPNALHHVFNSAETNELDRNTAITFVLQHLKTNIKEADQTRTDLLDWLRENPAKFAMQGRPNVTLFRLVDEKGQKTNVIVPTVAAPAGNTAGKSLPRHPQYRWTAKFVDIGIDSRAMFDDLVDYLKGGKPTLEDARHYAKRLKDAATANRLLDSQPEVEAEEEEEEVEEEAEVEAVVTFADVANQSAKLNPVPKMKHK